MSIHTYQRVITPEMFGAKHDGATDDSDALQNAIALATGKGVLHLSGQYGITRPMEVLGLCQIEGGDPRLSTIVALSGFTGNQMLRNWTAADWAAGETNHRVAPANPALSGTHTAEPYARISNLGFNAGNISNVACLSWAGPNETTILRNLVLASGASTTANRGIWGIDLQGNLIGPKLEDIVFYGTGWERQLSLDASAGSGANAYCDTITFSPSKLYHSMLYVNNVDDFVLSEYHLETAAGFDAAAHAYLYLVTHTGFGSYSFRDGHMMQNASTSKPFLLQDNDQTANLTRVTPPLVDRLKIQKTTGAWTGNFISDAYNNIALGTMEVIHRYDGQRLAYSNADGSLHTAGFTAAPPLQPYTYHGIGVSSPVAIDGSLGGIHLLRPTTATGFTISNPTNPVQGTLLTIVIWNDSGGAMGTVTWSSAYDLDGAYTNPAAGDMRAITFYYDGPTWVELSRSGGGTAGATVSAERALSMGLGGTVPATAADTADFVVQVPFNMTLKRLKVTAKTAPGGAMAVQLRRSTNATTPSYSNVSGFVATFTASQSSAVVDPADVDVNEGDLLNFSVSTGGGQNLLVEAIGVTR
jgi:hypothetical protein